MLKKANDNKATFASYAKGVYSIRNMAPEFYRTLPTEQRKAHDAGFAFLSNNLAKIDKTIYKPLANITYVEDAKGCIEVGNELVDSIEYYSSDYTGLADTINNIFGAKGDIIPRVTGGLIQGRVPVYNFEIAYEFKFVELEKLAGKNVPVSIETVYQDLVTTGWDLFVNRVFYTGIGGEGGIFNHSKVKTYTLPGITSATISTVADSVLIAAINTMIKNHLVATNYNINTLPDTILVPTAIAETLANRVNALYTDYLINFLQTHNLATATARANGIENHTLRIVGRAQADDQGVAGKGRLAMYKKDPKFLKLHIPFDFKSFRTAPDMQSMSYVTLFVGQVSQLQLPYNEDSTEPGAVSYYDLAS